MKVGNLVITFPRIALVLLLGSLHACAINTAETPPQSFAPVSVASLSLHGPLQIRAYTPPKVAEYRDATIYYPLNVSTPLAAVAISPGWTHRQRNINWWGPRLASHGFAVLTLDVNQRYTDMPADRADDLLAALEVLRNENTRVDSPLYGRIDSQRLAVMGHSMGGGGTLLVAHEHGDQIKAAIPFNPWLPERTPANEQSSRWDAWLPDEGFSGITVPTLIIAGEHDRIAPVLPHAWNHFHSIPRSTTKVYMEFDDGDHYVANTGRGDYPTVSRYVIAWLKLYVDGDERYREFIYGEAAKADRPKFSRYITNP